MSKLLQIIEHFGINAQQRKLQEEVFELQEAIIKKSTLGIYAETNTNDIAEEIADCLVLLNQIKEYYKIDDDYLKKIMSQKIDRTLERIENKYYN